MSSKTEQTTNGGALDTVKWLLAIVFAAAAVVGNHYYADMSVVIRAAAAVVVIAIALGFALTTVKGKAALTFARESRMEIRKVVWPTRQETTQTTFIVLAVSVITALVLWGVDGIMVRLVNFITNV